MTAARAKAPTLVWLLTALTCLLAGMAIVESQHQAVALPYPEGPRVAVDTFDSVGPAATQVPTSSPILTSSVNLTPRPVPLFEDAPVWLESGSANLQLARLTTLPGGRVPTSVANGPTVLIVESGTLTVLTDGPSYVDGALDALLTELVLRPGERLVVSAGTPHALRNDGTTPVVALVVTITPQGTRTPTRDSAVPPRWAA
jgi:quercetin dioxygenase-like cupin family protein